MSTVDTETEEELTIAEDSATEQVPSDAENMTIGDEPMLCPHVCGAYVGASFAAGVAVGCYTERCIDGNPEPMSDVDATVEGDASIDEIVDAIEE